jgi:2-polyprenyl-6-hydroxyphenyl methylase/3-demethylubiquinone-9 3-methyltransferase
MAVQQVLWSAERIVTELLPALQTTAQNLRPVLVFDGRRASVHPYDRPQRKPTSQPAMRNHMPSKNTLCLWYEGDALAAANFYAQTFPDSSVGAIHRAPGDYPDGKQGDVLTVEFTVAGIPCIGLNGGPAFKHSEAFSFQIATDDQAETDRLWSAIVGNGGQESQCGWCKDRWGLSWQITPRALTAAFTDPDRAASKRAFEAMMTMRKIDIAKIEAARRG